MTTNAVYKRVFIVLLLLFGLSSIFVVHEGQSALIIRLGELVGANGGNTYAPGLHFKVPFVENVKMFDMRLQTFEQKSSRILTVQQKYVLVDYYVKWRINDLPLFYKRNYAQLGYGGFNSKMSISTLENLLSQKINNALRAEFGQHTITEVVSGERLNIMSKLLVLANEGAKELGVSVVDVRIKRIDLPAEVSQSVFDRMSADRKRVATKHRSNGMSESEAIKAQADAQVTVIDAKARSEAAAIKARGQGKAAKIYNDAFSRDPKFYQLIRSLSAYVNTFKQGRDLIVLRPKSSYFKYFTGPIDK